MSKNFPKKCISFYILVKTSLNPNKIPKLQINEKLHRNVNENMFSFIFLCGFSRVFMMGNKSKICYSFTLLVFIQYVILIHLNGDPVLLDCILKVFPSLML